MKHRGLIDNKLWWLCTREWGRCTPIFKVVIWDKWEAPKGEVLIIPIALWGCRNGIIQNGYVSKAQVMEYYSIMSALGLVNKTKTGEYGEGKMKM